MTAVVVGATAVGFDSELPAVAPAALDRICKVAGADVYATSVNPDRLMLRSVAFGL